MQNQGVVVAVLTPQRGELCEEARMDGWQKRVEDADDVIRRAKPPAKPKHCEHKQVGIKTQRAMQPLPRHAMACAGDEHACVLGHVLGLLHVLW